MGLSAGGPLHPHCLLDIVTAKPDGFGLADTGQNGNIIKLVYGMLKAQPFDMAAGIDVNDQQAGTGSGIFGSQRLFQRQPLECLVMARPRQTDHGRAADKGQATGIAGQKRHGCNGARGGINGAKLALP